MNLVNGGLVGWFDYEFIDANVRRATCHPDQRLGDVVRSQSFETFVDLFGAFGVALKPDERKLRFCKAGVDGANAHTGSAKFEANGASDLKFASFGGAIGGSALVSRSARD